MGADIPGVEKVRFQIGPSGVCPRVGAGVCPRVGGQKEQGACGPSPEWLKPEASVRETTGWALVRMDRLEHPKKGLPEAVG